MADWIVNFTKDGAHDPKRMTAEARALLGARLWGIPASAPTKDKPVPGDRLLLYVGAPDKAFVGHATIASTYHEWTPAEREVYPGTFPGGVALADDTRIYPTSVRLERVWPRTSLSATNKRGLFRSSLTPVPAEDFDLIATTGR
jgi:hypothetical protein